MKVAVIGSRSLSVSDLENYLPLGVTEIVSGGARGVDASAREFALARGLRLTEFLPQYGMYGRSAPLKRNVKLVDYADLVVAFWEGTSTGTLFVIQTCRARCVPVQIWITLDGGGSYTLFDLP